MKNTARICLLASAIAVAFHATAADEAAADSAGTVKRLDAVRVNASRVLQNKSGGALGNRSELDTPYSLGSVGKEDIEARQATTLAAIFAKDASVGDAGTEYSGFPSAIQVRGLASDFYNSLKIDGLPGGFFYGINLPTEFMDEVQLLKGSSGFLYGFATPGGIVNYVTKKPTGDDRASFDVGYKSGNIYSQHVDLNGRLFDDERFGIRLNASHEQGTSATGSEVERKAAAVALQARFTPALTWNLDAMAQQRDITRPQTEYYLSSSSSYLFTDNILPKALDGGDNLTTDQSIVDNTFFYLHTGLDWSLSEHWHLKLDLSKMHSRLLAYSEFSYLLNAQGDYRYSTWTGLDVSDTKFAQALLQGSFETGPISHELVAGASFEDDKMDLGKINFLQSSRVTSYSNIYTPTPVVWTPDPDQSTYKYTDTRQTAAFLSDTATWGRWSLLAGLRYTNYERMSYKTYSQNASGGLDFTYATYNKYPLTPTYALLFKPGEDATLYASYVESMERGTTVSSTYANANEILDPLMSKQYELGYKLVKPRWGASAAAFRIERGASYVTTDNYYVQSGIIRYEGIEAAGNVMPTPALRLDASAVYLDSAYRETSNAWLLGKSYPGARRLTGALAATYNVSAVPGLSLNLDGKYYGSGTALNNTTTYTVVKAGDYALFNAGIGYSAQLGTHDYTLRAQLNNLLDQNYWAVSSSYIYPGLPRTLSLNLKVDL